MDSPASDDTIDDLGPVSWGHPLTRMRDDPLYVAFAEALYGEALHEGSDDDDASDSSSVVYDIDFEEHIDQLILKDEESIRPLSLSHEKTSHDGIPFTLFPLPTTSTQLLVYLALNQRDARLDPWNPIPHIICAVDRTRTHDTVFLCLKHLVPFDIPPFRTVANWVDLFRQLLEGLSFLHEHGVVHGSISTAAAAHSQDQGKGVPGLMVDISADPNALDHPDQFDRTKYPVKYYFVDFSHARHSHFSSTTSPSLISAHSRPNSPLPPQRAPFTEDVHALGHLFANLLPNLPQSPLRKKLDSLSRSMVKGTLRTSEEARKLFEVLVGSVEGPALEQECTEKLKIYTVEHLHDDRPGAEGIIRLDSDELPAAQSQQPRGKLQPKSPTLPFGCVPPSQNEGASGRIHSAPATRRNSTNEQWPEPCTRVSEDHPGLGLVGLGLGVGLDEAWGDKDLKKFQSDLGQGRKKSKHAHHPSLSRKVTM
ncbi:hypothetical protein V5O48_010969 [Marasmius crinis-equi]|uniref:Protein kinase domain-containing protein n=1 Tax=Marasmius crinis-equi TaxID=585013 RepID=A0ABR3F6V2_9AGAR